MREELSVTLLVTRALDRVGVTYLVGGSLASSLYGLPRSTQDADVVADIREQHVPALIAALQDDFYLDEAAIRTAVRDRMSFNLIHLKTMFKVDVFVATGPRSARELERRRPYTLRDLGEEIIVASPEDVIVHKLYWYRLGDHVSDRQWSDALAVLRMRGARLDAAYMREAAESMGVTDLLEQALLAATPPELPTDEE